MDIGHRTIQQIERVASQAREELIQRIGVRLQQISLLAARDDNKTFMDASYDSSSSIEGLKREEARIGRDRLVRRAAYLWFLRLVAIRYMEVNDYLPHHVRMLSSREGTFEPECLGQAMDMPFESLNLNVLSRLVQRGDDKAVLKELLLAQCSDLRRGMPYLFDEYDSPYNLLLPDGLFNNESFLYRLVCNIPEKLWERNADILAYLFEGYAESRKSQVRGKVKRDFRIAGEDLAVMSQTCTAGWMGHMLVDNALGRTFQEMAYEGTTSRCEYLIPTSGKGVRTGIALEELSIMDYACGSGTLLAYAFDLLMDAYVAVGYAPRDAVRLILDCNLHGIEVSERAALHAMLVLSMKGCEYDKRFFRRGIAPSVVLLQPVELTPDEIRRCKRLSKHADLIDSLAHLGECGALLMPSEADLALIAGQAEVIGRSPNDANSALLKKLMAARSMLGELVAKHNVVICDPPKTGARRISRWFARWIVDHYPNNRNFLPACFIDRAVESILPGGHVAMLSTSALLFSNNGSAFREAFLNKTKLDCVVETTDSSGLRWSSEAAWFFGNVDSTGTVTCIRLNQHPKQKGEALRHMVAGDDPNGVFIRNQSFFLDIPGCPIAYWAPESMIEPIMNADSVSKYARFRTGLFTGNSERFMREWYELSLFDRGWEYHPYVNGGMPRKWYGNLSQVLRWANDGEEIKRSYSASSIHMDNQFKPGIVWDGGMCFRMLDSGEFMVGSYGIITADDRLKSYLLGLFNSSTYRLLYRAVNSDGNCTGGEIVRSPAIVDWDRKSQIERMVNENVALSAADDKENEASWEFPRHSLLG